MSDQRPNDTQNAHEADAAERASLPPDLLPIHDRLTGDGARWRHRAPDGGGLGDWARATLATRSAPGATRLQERRLATFDSDETTGPRGPQHDMTMQRLRGYASAAAAVLVVGLIALLLTHGAGGRNRTGGNASITPTPGPSGTPTVQQATAFLQVEQLPVLAASDPKVAYRINNGRLLRSSDGGATYATATLPKNSFTQIDSLALAVSPLDANHIFVAIAGKKSDAGCAPPANPYPSMVMHGGIMASGYAPCADQFMSVDGGQTWTSPKLPTKGVLGGLNQYRAVPGAYGDESYTFQAQGQRLYAAMSYSVLSGSLVDLPGVRLVASDDGGQTWRFIDNGLATASRYVCDFGAAPQGQVVYAVTGDNQCGPMSYPNLSLWRSDDGGQSWTRVRALPTLAETGLFVGAHGELYLYLPQVTVQGHGANMTAAPSDAVVSLDLGKTFSNAPTSGLPSGANLVGPYATLTDGSIVYGEYQSGSQLGPSALYFWSKGHSWTKVGIDVSAGVAAVHAQPVASGDATQTLTIVDDAGNIEPVQIPLGQYFG